MRGASAGRAFKSRGRLLLLLIAGRPRQQSRKTRLPRCFPIVFASKDPAARTKVVAARAPMAGGGERSRVPAGAAGLAVWATLLCNAASLAYFLRSYVVDGSRRRRGCVARSGADDGALRPEEDGALRSEDEDLELCAPAHPSSLAVPRRGTK
jgi:L-tryptophan--pyruvate aminotransferase